MKKGVRNCIIVFFLLFLGFFLIRKLSNNKEGATAARAARPVVKKPIARRGGVRIYSRENTSNDSEYNLCDITKSVNQVYPQHDPVAELTKSDLLLSGCFNESDIQNDSITKYAPGSQQTDKNTCNNVEADQRFYLKSISNTKNTNIERVDLRNILNSTGGINPQLMQDNFYMNFVNYLSQTVAVIVNKVYTLSDYSVCPDHFSNGTGSDSDNIIALNNTLYMKSDVTYTRPLPTTEMLAKLNQLPASVKNSPGFKNFINAVCNQYPGIGVKYFNCTPQPMQRSTTYSQPLNNFTAAALGSSNTFYSMEQSINDLCSGKAILQSQIPSDCSGAGAINDANLSNSLSTDQKAACNQIKNYVNCPNSNNHNIKYFSQYCSPHGIQHLTDPFRKGYCTSISGGYDPTVNLVPPNTVLTGTNNAGTTTSAWSPAQLTALYATLPPTNDRTTRKIN